MSVRDTSSSRVVADRKSAHLSEELAAKEVLEILELYAGVYEVGLTSNSGAARY